MTDLNTGNRKSVRAAEKESRLAQRATDEVLALIMSESHGRFWIHELLRRCHVGSNPFSPDALLMAHQCGEFNIGIQIWADLMRVCPDQYVQMMREANGRDNPKPKRADDANGSGIGNYSTEYEPDLFDDDPN